MRERIRALQGCARTHGHYSAKIHHTTKRKPNDMYLQIIKAKAA